MKINKLVGAVNLFTLFLFEEFCHKLDSLLEITKELNNVLTLASLFK